MVGPAAPPLLGPLFTAAGGLLRAWLSMDPLHHGLEVLFLALFVHLATQTAYAPSRRRRLMPRLLGGRGREGRRPGDGTSVGRAGGSRGGRRGKGGGGGSGDRGSGGVGGAPPVRRPLTAAEAADRVAAWTPDALHVDTNDSRTAPGRPGAAEAVSATVAAEAAAAAATPVLLSPPGPTVTLRAPGGAAGAPPLAGVTNLASLNYQSMAAHPAVKAACRDTLTKLGCGSCGPRGFYGTATPHLLAEAALARYAGAPEAILYSFGGATASSAVPAFCKRGDVCVADDGVGPDLVRGMLLSRATIVWYAHNDMTALGAALAAITDGDRRGGGGATSQRRFIVTEAVSSTYGDVAPLATIVALRRTHRFRLILDESHSLGVLGAAGGGLLAATGVANADVDVRVADLGAAFGTVGGMCVGSEPAVVDHQRLSGAGYCFSAAQPPFLATAVVAVADVLTAEGEARSARLRRNVAALRGRLMEGALPPDWVVEGGTDGSALLFVRRAPSAAAVSAATAATMSVVDGDGDDSDAAVGEAGSGSSSGDDDPRPPPSPVRGGGGGGAVAAGAAVANATARRALEALLDHVAARLLSHHRLFVAVPRYVGGELTAPPPALRLAVQADHTVAAMETAAEAIGLELAAATAEGVEPLLCGV
ncbi:hypothetical protein MMPV_000032 [Pyropia vietnamensis]